MKQLFNLDSYHAGRKNAMKLLLLDIKLGNLRTLHDVKVNLEYKLGLYDKEEPDENDVYDPKENGNNFGTIMM